MTHRLEFRNTQHHTEVAVQEPTRDRLSNQWVLPVEIVDGRLAEFEAEMSVSRVSFRLTREQAEAMISTLQASLEGCPS
jgi:hypothetical protein